MLVSFIDKLSTPKKSYRNCSLGGSSTDVVEELEYSISCADTVLPPNPNESACEIGRHDSRRRTEIA